MSHFARSCQGIHFFYQSLTAIKDAVVGPNLQARQQKELQICSRGARGVAFSVTLRGRWCLWTGSGVVHRRTCGLGEHEMIDQTRGALRTCSCVLSLGEAAISLLELIASAAQSSLLDAVPPEAGVTTMNRSSEYIDREKFDRTINRTGTQTFNGINPGHTTGRKSS